MLISSYHVIFITIYDIVSPPTTSILLCSCCQIFVFADFIGSIACHDVTASAGTPSISLSSSTSSVDSGYVFRHDPALLLSGLNHSEDDIKSFLSDIQCPVLYIVLWSHDLCISNA
jgi:hypothetical protein